MPPIGVHVFFSCVTLPSWSRGFDPAPRHCSLVLVPATIKHLWNLPFPDWQCQGISTLHSPVRMLFCCRELVRCRVAPLATARGGRDSDGRGHVVTRLPALSPLRKTSAAPRGFAGSKHASGRSEFSFEDGVRAQRHRLGQSGYYTQLRDVPHAPAPLGRR